MKPYIAKSGDKLSHNIDDYPEGIILCVDKPYRWTSADVIRKIKWLACRHFGKKNLKVGHAGTLDPLATGVLLVCIGKATKLAQQLQDGHKEYLAGVSFGATTASYDLEKEIDRTFTLEGVTRQAVEGILPSFIGVQMQVAPLFSAKSVDGVRVYETARKLYKEALREGRPFDESEAGDLIHASRITIDKLELMPEGYAPRIPETRDGGKSFRINVCGTDGYTLLQTQILVGCSKGTYIRALARDLGEALGTGAFLHSLRRTAVGPFTVGNALSIEDSIVIFSDFS